MHNKLLDSLNKLSTTRTADEKIVLMNSVLTEVINPFYGKAAKSKQYFKVYKYGSMVLAAATSIVSSLQDFYPSTFPQWVLPIIVPEPLWRLYTGCIACTKIWIQDQRNTTPTLVQVPLVPANHNQY